jgi:hypothetical protein
LSENDPCTLKNKTIETKIATPFSCDVDIS